MCEPSERERKRAEASTSKYFAHDDVWEITYTGKKPTDERVRTVIAKAKAKYKRCSYASDTLVWRGDKCRFKFKHSLAGSTARTTLMKLLSACLHNFNPNFFDFDVISEHKAVSETGEPLAKALKKSPGTSASHSVPQSGGEETPVDSAATAALHSCVATAAHDSSAATAAHDMNAAPAATDTPQQTQLRFKAITLMRSPMVPEWIPRAGISHSSGTFGEVIFAFHKEMGKNVAIKALKEAGTTGKQTLHFFEELEALFVASGHECTIKLVDVVCVSNKNLGFVFDRLGGDLDTMIKLLIKREGAGGWPHSSSQFKEAFGGLWSALAFLAERGLAHTDIKPANICHAHMDRTDSKLVLCDFGQAELRGVQGCCTILSRSTIEKTKAIEVSTLPYRAPELLFGISNYNVGIDVWSLGIVMIEAAQGQFLFRHLTEEHQYRRHFREHGDTSGYLDSLKASPHGTEKDWKPHKGDLIPDTVVDFLGAAGGQLLEGALRLDPAVRLSAKEALATPYFSSGMLLLIWSFSATAEKVTATAAPVGGDKTVIAGERGECQFALGHLSSEALQLFRDDEFWQESHGYDWKHPKGHKKAEMQANCSMEKPEEGSCNLHEQKENVKLQISGYVGKCLRTSCNALKTNRPFPIKTAVAFVEAFRNCNDRIWNFIDNELHHGPMSRFDPEELGSNGEQILSTKARDWIGNIGTLQVERLFEHKLKAHFDGGAACVLIVVTQEGSRKLSLFPDAPTGDTETVVLKPGMVYLTGVCGVQHQVSYDGQSSGRHIPDLGEVGISYAFRTCLFRHSPYTSVRPGPDSVWREFNRVLRLVHSKFSFVMPTAQEILAAMPS